MIIPSIARYSLNSPENFNPIFCSAPSISSLVAASVEQLFSDFYEHHKGEALSEAAKTSIQTIIKEVRKESCE